MISCVFSAFILDLSLMKTAFILLRNICKQTLGNRAVVKRIDFRVRLAFEFYLYHLLLCLCLHFNVAKPEFPYLLNYEKPTSQKVLI